jgi:hypothetical protein
MATDDAWDYLVIAERERDRLPSLGREGWELVAVGGEPADQRLYLKRRITSLRDRVTAEQRAHYYRSLGLDPNADAGIPE